ncbi:MAG: hypothetical protein HQ488_04320 [Parcubacteria group bacterium]|nr:hypothetical protein [Parcubacteria group bacterium]
MVFEEVADDENVEDMTFKEDPVEAAVTKILDLQQKAGDAEISGASSERKAMLAVQLAQAKFEQARLNERSGRGQKGEADKLLQDWQTKQDALDGQKGGAISEARKNAESKYDLSPDDIAQMRRHQGQ